MKPFEHYATVYLSSLGDLGYSESAVVSSRLALRHFKEYLKTRGIAAVRDVRRADVVGFIGYLEEREVKQFKRPMSRRTIKRFVSVVRGLFGFLYRHEYLISNPAEDVSFVKVMEKRKEIFYPDEIAELIDAVDLLYGGRERNRAVFELLYSAGLRVSELVKLDVTDVDFSSRVLTVRLGKGGRDRFVPFSEIAAYRLKQYVEGERRDYEKMLRMKGLKKRAGNALFLTEYGRLRTVTVALTLRKLLKHCGITRAGLSPHSIRHSCAAHLLENGADVRYVQELLGHDSIETTVQYTKLKIESLRKLYRRFHPRENRLYVEVDDAYLAAIESLKREIALRRVTNERYPPSNYNVKRNAQS
jgi:site-specific recombinase XerD